MTEQAPVLQIIDTATLRMPAEVVARAEDLVGKCNRAVIASEKDYADSADLMAVVNAHLRKIDDDKDTVARPLNAALDAFYKLWHQARDPLAAGKAALLKTQNAYIELREQRRLAEEKRLKEEADAKALAEAQRLEAEAKRLADEAAAAAAVGDQDTAVELQGRANATQNDAAQVIEEAASAPAPYVPAPAMARGSYGSVGTRTVWEGTITDYPLLLTVPTVRDNAKVREAVQKVVDGMVKGGTRTLAGVSITSKKVANNRS